MAWPRIKNSRSSAQPGTHPHNGVQASVTPAPDAEPPPGRGQNTGISGTTHAVASNGGSGSSTAGDGPRPSRRLRPIRYGHAAQDQVPAGQRTAAPPPTARAATETAPPARAGSGSAPADPRPPRGTPRPDLTDDDPGDYEGTAGLVYEAQHPAFEPVPNEGLGIFGVETTEVPQDEAPAAEAPARELRRQPPPPPAAGAGLGPAAGPTWNQPIAPPPAASSGAEERKQNPFGRIRGMRLGGAPARDGEPRVSVRELPPDVQLRFIRDRVIIVAIIGVASYLLWRAWPVSVTLVIIAWVADTMRRSRSAALYVNGGAHPGARKATSKQLRKMRRDGYFTLENRPIPDSREIIDHLVIGPTGVYAIDSEKWNPKLPIRTWNNKKLYHGPESQKDRLEHAVWEAAQASEILSGALGTEVKVRPALAIYGPKIPWNVATIRNVDVFTGPALVRYLKGRGRMKDGVPRLTREEVATIYDTAERVLPDIAQTHAPVG